MASNMQIATGKGEGATKVDVTLPEPTTFNDPQWKRWNMAEADICSAAVRTVRVDIANGGARKELRKAVKRGVKGAKLVEVVQKFVDTWQRGAQRGRKVIDLRGVPGLTAEQVAGIKAENPGAEILTA